MNRWYKQLQELAVETRKKNAAFFEAAHGDPRLSADFEKIWRNFDSGVSAIRGDIAECVREKALSAAALTSFDNLVLSLGTLSGRSGGDWIDNPSETALVGAEAVIGMAGPLT